MLETGEDTMTEGAQEPTTIGGDQPVGQVVAALSESSLPPASGGEDQDKREYTRRAIAAVLELDQNDLTHIGDERVRAKISKGSESFMRQHEQLRADHERVKIEYEQHFVELEAEYTECRTRLEAESRDAYLNLARANENGN